MQAEMQGGVGVQVHRCVVKGESSQMSCKYKCVYTIFACKRVPVVHARAWCASMCTVCVFSVFTRCISCHV